MSTREAVLQAVRSWLILATGADSGHVIPADDRGPKPAPPYLAVKVTTDGIRDHEDEVRHTLGHVVTVTGGSGGDPLTVTVNGAAVAYTRTADDTDATAATGLATAIIAADEDVFADPSGATVTISPVVGDLTVTVEDPHLSLDPSTVPVELVRGTASARVSIHGYGATSAEWLATAQRALRLDSVLAQADADGVTIEADGAVVDMSTRLDTAIEPRFLLEATVSYAFATDGEALVALRTVSLTYTGEIYASAPDPLIASFSVEV